MVTVITSIYIIGMLVWVALKWKQLSKQTLSSVVSGSVLLAYSIYLHHIMVLQTRPFIAILAVGLLQLSHFKSTFCWKEQVIKLVWHALLLWMLLV